MTQNNLQFSETLDNLTAEEEAWLNEQLELIAVYGDDEFPLEDPTIAMPASKPDFSGPRFLRDNPDFESPYDTLGFDFEFCDGRDGPSPSRYLWFNADDYGNPDHVAWLVQKFLKRFRPDQCWSLTYASTCSKLRVGEFGGGAVFVTADEIVWQNAYNFVEQQQARFKAGKATAEVAA